MAFKRVLELQILITMLVRRACYALSHPQCMITFVCVPPLTTSASLSELRLVSAPPEWGYVLQASGRRAGGNISSPL